MANIVCSGSQSCVDSVLIWTGDDTSNILPPLIGNSSNITKYEASIFCTATSSCSGATMESAYYIFCGAAESCEGALILSAKKMYCTRNGCTGASIRKVETIYFIEENEYATVYSGYIGVASMYFRGSNAGNNVRYVCSAGDFCHIYCGHGACNDTTTEVLCYGKCNITCEDTGANTFDNNGNSVIDCVSIESSLSPTMPPTNAPTFSPTATPTHSPTITPTDSPNGVTDAPLDIYEEIDSDISYWFNLLLGISISLTIFTIVVGCLDARIWRKNELFNWKSIMKFGFYTNDFLSGL